jgi:hypothetical protein
MSLGFMCGLKSSRSLWGPYSKREAGGGPARVMFCIGQHYSFFARRDSWNPFGHRIPHRALYPFRSNFISNFFVTDYEQLYGW